MHRTNEMDKDGYSKHIGIYNYPTHRVFTELARPVLRIGGQLVVSFVAALDAPIHFGHQLATVGDLYFRRGIALIVAVLFHFGHNAQTSYHTTHNYINTIEVLAAGGCDKEL